MHRDSHPDAFLKLLKIFCILKVTGAKLQYFFKKCSLNPRFFHIYQLFIDKMNKISHFIH